jgi:hypothetical protein
MLAVAHALLVMADDMIPRRAPSREAGANCFDRLPPEDPARRLIKRLERLGYPVIRQNPSPNTVT